MIFDGGDVTAGKDEKKIQLELGRTWDRPMWGLWLSICIRAVHQLGAALFLASVLLYDTGKSLSFLYLALFSGIALIIAEAVRHRQMHRELAGVVTFCKCVLIGIGFHGLFPPEPTILAGFILASIGAHAPKHMRHRLLF